MIIYDITNRKEVVREIKKYLYLVSENLYESIPRTTIDGYFDEETKNAVIEFQKIKGIKPSGEVDYETFVLLFDDYSSAVFDIEFRDQILTDNGFPYTQGDISEDVQVLHLMINELSKTYTNIPSVKSAQYYSGETVKSVSQLRQLFQLEEGDFVDKILYQRMRKEIASRIQADKINII